MMNFAREDGLFGYFLFFLFFLLLLCFVVSFCCFLFVIDAVTVYTLFPNQFHSIKVEYDVPYDGSSVGAPVCKRCVRMSW